MNVTPAEVGAFLAAAARVGGLVATAPVIGDPGVPARARLIAVVAIAGVLAGARAPIALADVPAAVAGELAVGGATGLIARAAIARVAIAGQLMGLSLGLGFAAEYDVRAGESAGVLRSLISALAGLAFLAAGGLEAIVRSAAAPVPVAALPSLATALIRHATFALEHGVGLAAPTLLAAFVGNLALAVMNRAAPAINVFSVALAAVLVIGAVALTATAPTLVGQLLTTARIAVDALAP